MYVLIDGVTAGCQAYLQPPCSLSPRLLSLPPHHSLPSSFNLAAEAKESGSESHQGTLLVFKHHTHASPSRSCHLALTAFSPLHAYSFPPPCSFVSVLTSPSSLVFLTLTDKSVQPWWCKTPCQFLFCAHFGFFFCLNRNSSTLKVFYYFFLLHLNLFKIENTIGNVNQDKPNLINGSLFDTFFFSSVWISALMSDTLQPLPLSYSHFVCVSDHLSPELVKSHFPKVCQGGGKNYKSKKCVFECEEN